MLTVLYAICAMCGWGALGQLAWMSRNRWNPPRAALLTGFALLAIGMSIWTLSLAIGLDSVEADELVRVCAHLCVMGIAATASVGLLHLAHPSAVARPRGRRRILGATIAAILLVALYLRIRGIHPPARLNVEDARHLAVTVYLVVYLGTVAVYSIDITRLLWRLATITTRPWLSHGLRVAAVGAALGVPYAVSKAGYAVSFWLRLDPPSEHVTTGLLLTASSLLYAIGLTMPAWGPSADGARRWPRRLRCYRQLEPLWRDLASVVPHLVLDGARQHRRYPLRGLGFALHRRIVEISDARLALRAYTDATVAEQARRAGEREAYSGKELDAYVEAARIAAGVAALRT
ncbi:MAG: hypothetical protein JXA67_13110, partial [Micromonosporaceae bacterium]|nr:hypothetical protein [Micromonosporaceae bacterium]